MSGKKYKKVLLLLNWYLPRLHRGIIDYARRHEWFLEVAHSGYFYETTEQWNGDGIITDMNCNLDKLHHRGVKIAACVAGDLFRQYADCVVCADDQCIGENAADYFRHKGFRSFAVSASPDRQFFFVERLKQFGMDAVVLPSRTDFHKMDRTKTVSEILMELKKPCAVFCENDWISSYIFNLAVESGLKVPEELSILGVGNDELLCNSAFVSLSSMETRLYERGLKIAEALDRVLDGQFQEKITRVKPLKQIIERESTAAYAVSDPTLKKMIRFLIDHAGQPIRVSDLSEHFHLSESAIYRIFIKQTGLSPKQMLLNIRMDLAQSLLLDTETKITAIAAEAGFPTAASFFEAFRKIHGQTPQIWRQNSR